MEIETNTVREQYGIIWLLIFEWKISGFVVKSDHYLQTSEGSDVVGTDIVK